MSTPYGPSGSPEPTRPGQEPPGQGYVGTPSGGFPAQDPNWGHQQGYPPGYTPQGHPPPGYPAHPPGYGPQGYPPPGYTPQGYPPPPGYGQPYGSPPPGYDQWQQPYPEAYPEPHAGGYGPPEPPPEGRPALPWLLVGMGGVALALLVFLGFVRPGFFTTTVFDQSAVQDGVRRILSDDYGQDAQQVSCPAGQRVEVGSTFTCQATIGGAQRTVNITVKTDAGEYEVARPS